MPKTTGPRLVSGDPWRDLYWVRAGVRGVLALGVGASIVANVLHAQPNLVGRVIAAWSPLALLLAVELISRVPVYRPVLSAVRMIAAAIIAGIAAWVSYWHMVSVAVRFGETPVSAHLLPVSVDGLVVVAAVSLADISARFRDAADTGDPNTQQAAADASILPEHSSESTPEPTQELTPEPTPNVTPGTTGEVPVDVAEEGDTEQAPDQDGSAQDPTQYETSREGDDQAGTPDGELATASPATPVEDGSEAETVSRAPRTEVAGSTGSTGSTGGDESAGREGAPAQRGEVPSVGRRPGRRAGSDVAVKIRKIAAANPTWTYEQIAERAGCSPRTVGRYLPSPAPSATPESPPEASAEHQKAVNVGDRDQAEPPDSTPSESAAA